MSNPEDFTTGVPEFLPIEKIVVFNPNPYPFQITESGHLIGGGESAIVPRQDRFVIKALEARLVSIIEPQQAATTKKKKS